MKAKNEAEGRFYQPKSWRKKNTLQMIQMKRFKWKATCSGMHRLQGMGMRCWDSWRWAAEATIATRSWRNNVRKSFWGRGRRYPLGAIVMKGPTGDRKAASKLAGMLKKCSNVSLCPPLSSWWSYWLNLIGSQKAWEPMWCGPKWPTCGVGKDRARYVGRRLTSTQTPNLNMMQSKLISVKVFYYTD